MPQMSEAAEVAEAEAKGIDIFSGHRPAAPNGGAKYDVDGVLLERPFKITKIGPVRLFVDDVDQAEAFYTRHLGLVKSEETHYRGARCVFLRCGAEHHLAGALSEGIARRAGSQPAHHLPVVRGRARRITRNCARRWLS